MACIVVMAALFVGCSKSEKTENNPDIKRVNVAVKSFEKKDVSKKRRNNETIEENVLPTTEETNNTEEIKEETTNPVNRIENNDTTEVRATRKNDAKSNKNGNEKGRDSYVYE